MFTLITVDHAKGVPGRLEVKVLQASETRGIFIFHQFTACQSNITIQQTYQHKEIAPLNEHFYPWSYLFQFTELVHPSSAMMIE